MLLSESLKLLPLMKIAFFLTPLILVTLFLVRLVSLLCNTTPRCLSKTRALCPSSLLPAFKLSVQSKDTVLEFTIGFEKLSNFICLVLPLWLAEP